MEGEAGREKANKKAMVGRGGFDAMSGSIKSGLWDWSI